MTNRLDGGPAAAIRTDDSTVVQDPDDSSVDLQVLPEVTQNCGGTPTLRPGSGGTTANLDNTQLAAGVIASDRFPPRLLEVGERVDRYRLEQRLGVGGMGAVFRARDELLQREIALKVILPEYFKKDPAAGLRFLREAEIVAGLTHSHIVRLLTAGLDDGITFATFEFADGWSLAKHLRRGGRLGVEATVAVLLPVLSAVSYAHLRGVVHGDLKPTNIVVARDHLGRAHPMVLDFGVSFFADVDPTLDPTRQDVTGTPGYLAPEWLSYARLDERLDCFSLGSILYECLTGANPFAQCRRLSEAAMAACRRSYPAPSAVADTPRELDAVVARALAPRPAQRYATVGELARDLLPFADDDTRSRWTDDFKFSRARPHRDESDWDFDGPDTVTCEVPDRK